MSNPYIDFFDQVITSSNIVLIWVSVTAGLISTRLIDKLNKRTKIGEVFKDVIRVALISLFSVFLIIVMFAVFIALRVFITTQF